MKSSYQNKDEECDSPMKIRYSAFQSERNQMKFRINFLEKFVE